MEGETGGFFVKITLLKLGNITERLLFIGKMYINKVIVEIKTSGDTPKAGNLEVFK